MQNQQPIPHRPNFSDSRTHDLSRHGAYAPNVGRGDPARGKIRNPVGVALLTLITFGIYGYFWGYRAFREVDLHSGQQHNKALFISGLALLPVFFIGSFVQLIYLGLEMENLRNAKQIHRLSPGMGQGGFWALIGGVFIASLIWFWTVFPMILMGASFLMESTDSYGPMIVGLSLAGLVLIAIFLSTYAIMQHQINKYWKGAPVHDFPRQP